MSTIHHTQASATSTAAAPTRRAAPDRRLLAAGIAAGPVFLGVGLVHAHLREGFDLQQHALSQLSLGSWGGVQIATFLVTGMLVIAWARGLRKALGRGPGEVWAPRLLAGFGVGMLIAGVFVADAAHSFPVGTPAGPADVSWHGALHGLGFLVAMVSWTSACLVLTRAYSARGDRRQAVLCLLAVLSVVVVAVAPLGSFGVRAVVLSAVQLGLVAALSARALRAGATATQACTKDA